MWDEVSLNYPGSEFSRYGDVVATSKFGLRTHISTAYALKERERRENTCHMRACGGLKRGVV